MPESRTYYQVLNVQPAATPEEITQAYRSLARTFHPDLQPPEMQVWANERMQVINAAYEVLSDPRLRSRYNASLFPSVTPTTDAPMPPDVAAYNFRMTGQAARQVVDILLVANAVIYVLLLSSLPSVFDTTNSPGPILPVLLCGLFLARQSNAAKERVPFILGGYIFAGGLLLWSVAPLINADSQLSPDRFSLIIAIWLTACVLASIIVVRHFKVERP
ncbi:MAG: J domain-containing protein [Thermoflexales bacterium]|nr:J domain-containing protein [Thermoflexales bacterium]